MTMFRVNNLPDRGSFADGNGAALKYDVLKQVGSHDVPSCIDLSGCCHLKPYSIACLCGLAALGRVQSRDISLILPNNADFSEHLCRLELPQWFQCGPLPEVIRRDSNLPVEQVRWPPGHASERIIDMLVPNAGVSANVVPNLKSALDEIIRNALTHAESPIDCIVVGQAFPGTGKVEVCVLDLGQTIRGHLTKNPDHQNLASDRQAIEHATVDGVTGTLRGTLNRRGEPNSGIGLHFVRDMCERGQGELTILSGDAWVTYSQNPPVSGDIIGPKFKGCLVNVRFFTDSGLPSPPIEQIL